jgi:outer membrane protein
MATFKGITQQVTDSMYSLKQCVEIGIANNLLVNQADFQATIDNIALRQSRDNRLPQIEVASSHGLNQGRNIDPFTNTYLNQNINFSNYNLSGGITLFNGGFIKNTIIQNEKAAQASRLDLQQQKETITLNIILAYLQILTNQDLLQQAKNQYDLTRQQVERLNILNKEGSIIPSQLYELKGQLANDELSIINSENAIDAARLILCQLMNIPYKKLNVEPVAANDEVLIYDTNPSAIYNAALLKFPSVKAAELRSQSLIAGIKAAKGALYPTIGISAGLYTYYSSAARKDFFVNTTKVPSGDFVTISGSEVPVITSQNNFVNQKINYSDQFMNNYSTSVSAFVRIPIINYRQARNNISLAKVRYKNALFLQQNASNSLSQFVEEAFFNMSAGYKKFSTLKNQVSDFEEAYKIAEVRYNAGVSNQVEYLIAKNNFDRSRINLIIAKYEYILRTKVLDYYQGNLSM